VRLPVQVTVPPAGAEVRLGDRKVGVTPCVVEYSPFEETRLTLRHPGHETVRQQLPDYREITGRTKAVQTWSPVLSTPLKPGPLWRIPVGDLTPRSLWVEREVPLVLAGDGARIHLVDVESGTLGRSTSLESRTGVLQAGVLADGSDWQISGPTTLTVRRSDGTMWMLPTRGGLSRPPTSVQGSAGPLVVMVDEIGTAYGVRASDGRELWRRALGIHPSQAPVATALGAAVCGEDGSAWLLSTGNGDPRKIVQAGQAPTLVFDLKDGILVVGNAPDGCRRGRADGRWETLGASHPVAGIPGWSAASGAAWVEADGVRWMAAGGDAVVSMPALGAPVLQVVGDGDVLYAAGADGVLRAARPSAPETLLWSCPLGGRPQLPLALNAEAVFALVDGAVLAVAR
jgi:outer membrane protein assembly factor BamB